MSKRAFERAFEFYPLKDYNKESNYIHSCDSKTLDVVYREVFQLGYEQAEKDILSKITPEHIAGLKWIGTAGISSQPYPYHKYCKDLLKTLEELLNNE